MYSKRVTFFTCDPREMEKNPRTLHNRINCDTESVI